MSYTVGTISVEIEGEGEISYACERCRAKFNSRTDAMRHICPALGAKVEP